MGTSPSSSSPSFPLRTQAGTAPSRRPALTPEGLSPAGRGSGGPGFPSPARIAPDSGRKEAGWGGTTRTPPAVPFPLSRSPTCRGSPGGANVPSPLLETRRTGFPPCFPTPPGFVCVCVYGTLPPSPALTLCSPGPREALPAGPPAVAPRRLNGGGGVGLLHPPLPRLRGGSPVPEWPQAPSFPRSSTPRVQGTRGRSRPRASAAARRARTVQRPRQGGSYLASPLSCPPHPASFPREGPAGTGAFGGDEPRRSRPPSSSPAPRSCLLPFSAGRLRPQRERGQETAVHFKPPGGRGWR